MLPIVLRVLLSLVLVLNGAGYAVAATTMQLGNMEAASPSGDTSHPAGSSCHQAAADDAVPAHASDHQSPAKPDHPVPDCCKAGMCSCACVQQAQVAVQALVLPLPTFAPVVSVHRLASGYVAPALPHLIRPPIG